MYIVGFCGEEEAGHAIDHLGPGGGAIESGGRSFETENLAVPGKEKSGKTKIKQYSHFVIDANQNMGFRDK